MAAAPPRRRLLAGLALGATLWLAGCASTPAIDPQARAVLAPTGTLRVAVYQGSPTSFVRKPMGEGVGIAYELGQALGRELGVPVQVIEFDRVAQVVDALRTNQADFTFTNATAPRARDVDFTDPLVRLELGYLVAGDSTWRNVSEVDRPGAKIGVSQGSTSQSTLPGLLRSATLVPVPSLGVAQQLLKDHVLDAFATNKGILFEMSDQVPGSRVLEGRWGLENLAIAIPKGREAALPALRGFAQRMRASGQLQRIIERAGLRGTARD
jgi:polar amino acid transport system substrate-binding protein